MQKHAYSTVLSHYRTLFEPLPTSANSPVYFDRKTGFLPYAEDFPKLHYHDRYEIGICEEGEALFISRGVYGSVTAGDLVFIPAGDRHYSRSLRADAQCRMRFVYVRPESVAEALGLSGEADREKLRNRLARIPLVIRPDEAPQAAELLGGIVELCDSSFRHREQTVILRLALFLLESERWFEAHGEKTEGAGGALESVGDAVRVAEYLSLHYREAQSAKALAELCHLSESQLRRTFVAAYGMPPIAYRNTLRCKIGAELLARTNLPIAEISERLGYNTSADFYRMFRKLWGASPSEFRKTASGNRVL